MVNSNIVIENARLIFRNFSGKETTFNPAGSRNFCVLLDNDLGEKLTEDGWNVKWLKAKDEEDPPQAYLQVTVSFVQYPPKITIITSSGKRDLDENSVNVLDWAEIEAVDLVIRPYNWSMPSGKSGVKAYIKSMYVTLVEDEFEKKYANIPRYSDDEVQ